MRAFVQRWWIFGTLPFGIFVAWLMGDLPPVIVGLFVAASTLVAAGIFHWRFVVWKRQAQEDLVEALADMPVYLTSDMWALATKKGLISPEVLTRVREKQAARRAAQRAEEEG